MVRVGRVGGRDFDVFAEHAASRVDVFLRELHGGDVGGAEVRHGTGQREQAGRHERIGFRAAGRAGRSRIGRAGRTAAGERHDCGGHHGGGCDGQFPHALHVDLLHLNHRFLSWLR